jgi:hypothetical protein
LERLTDGGQYLFSVSDFSSLFPVMESQALLVFLGRAVKAGILEHFCRGMYIYPKAH